MQAESLRINPNYFELTRIISLNAHKIKHDIKINSRHRRYEIYGSFFPPCIKKKTCNFFSCNGSFYQTDVS